MTTIYGIAQVDPSDYQFARQIGTEVLYDAVGAYTNAALSVVNDSLRLLVEPTPTTAYSERFKLPMSGRMEKQNVGAMTPAVRRTGSWDVGYPLYTFKDSVHITDVDFAYMTPMEFQAQIDGIIARHANAQRHEILTALLDNTSHTFSDELNGDVTLQPLANGDSVIYPPAMGSDDERTLDAYVHTGYTVANVSSTNNPYATAHDFLSATFGSVTGGIGVVSLIPRSLRAKTEALAEFVPIQSNLLAQANMSSEYANNAINVASQFGELIGTVSGCYVVIWDYMPDNYAIHVHPNEIAPLAKRVDVMGTGLGDGELQLLETPNSGELIFNEWRSRFGIAVRNRLNGYVQYFAASGGYVIPTGYSR